MGYTITIYEHKVIVLTKTVGKRCLSCYLLCKFFL